MTLRNAPNSYHEVINQQSVASSAGKSGTVEDQDWHKPHNEEGTGPRKGKTKNMYVPGTLPGREK